MKKVFSFLLILLVAAFLYTSYKYTVIRKGTDFYFMEKNPPAFEEIYVDVTKWTFKDYALHPKISAFLAAKGVERTYKKMKIKVLDAIEKHKKEMEKGIEESEE